MLLEDREGRKFYLGQVRVESSISDPRRAVKQSESATQGVGQVRDRNPEVSAQR